MSTFAIIEDLKYQLEQSKANEARLAEELDRLKHTVKFQEDLYLKMHGGSWGECRFKANEAKLREALIWCGGSADFGPGGQAREGWLKLCAPLIEETKP